MSGKWGLHKFFARDPQIRPFLPPTTLFTNAAFSSYLAKYRSVYVKPTMTHMGRGIMKVWKSEQGYRFVKVRGIPVFCPTVGVLEQRLKNVMSHQAYIVQKALPLAQVGGRPFDIRVMMLRNGQDRWQYTGMLAKVAGQQSIVTNAIAGRGYVTTVDQALAQSLHMQPQQITSIKKRLISLSCQICRRFNQFKYSSRIGIDLAVDRNGRIWIIEVNFDYPSRAIFAKMADKTFYYWILRTIAAYRKRKRTI